ncbi:Transcriptional regulator, contains HTH domain [Halanaeroarchaeum sp. HSR-CO]|nr:Transcriptional regulator, contains HTH domain [Halanaeroarchaeum sp. HSR-CO]
MEFGLPATEFPLGGIFEHFSEVVIELERLIPHQSLVIPYFWVRGASPDDMATVFEGHPGLVSVVEVDRIEDEYLMKAEWERAYTGILSALAESNVVVLSGVGSSDGWRFEVRGEERADMGDLQTYCRDHDIPIDIVSIHALLPVRDERFGLTDTQREALVLAYERGYFDTPRTTSLSEIADELDITQQSLSSRLRRGHRRLVEATLIGSTKASDMPDRT